MNVIRGKNLQLDDPSARWENGIIYDASYMDRPATRALLSPDINETHRSPRRKKYAPYRTISLRLGLSQLEEIGQRSMCCSYLKVYGGNNNQDSAGKEGKDLGQTLVVWYEVHAKLAV